MRNSQDELIRRQNLWWTIWERIATEAMLKGLDAKLDIDRALSAKNEESGHFFSYFAGSNARDAFTLAALALEYREKAMGNG
jgi:hypothetical protein